MLGPGPRLIKKNNLLGRGLTKVENHCLKVPFKLDRAPKVLKTCGIQVTVFITTVRNVKENSAVSGKNHDVNIEVCVQNTDEFQSLLGTAMYVGLHKRCGFFISLLIIVGMHKFSKNLGATSKF